jgi:hypothetical protein
LLFYLCADRKNRLLYQFTAADGTSARLIQPFPFPENETALPANRWSNDKMFVCSPLDMFEMLVYFTLGNSHLRGYIFCRKRIALEQGHNFLPHCLLSCNRDDRFFRSLFHLSTLTEPYPGKRNNALTFFFRSSFPPTSPTDRIGDF